MCPVIYYALEVASTAMHIQITGNTNIHLQDL